MKIQAVQYKIWQITLIVVLGTMFATISAQSYVLVTMLYNETNPERVIEYKECLLRNASNPLIKKIHVLYDTIKDTNDTNPIKEVIDQIECTVTCIQGRPTFDFIFTLINQTYPDAYIILANGDMYFNDTLYKLSSFNKWDTTFFALTRWNVQDDYQSLRLEGFGPHTPNNWSADTWIFKTPITPFIGTDHICMGSERCDHKLAYAAKQSGYAVINPCLSIQTCHLHISQIRHYKEDNAITDDALGSSCISWSYLEGYEHDWYQYTHHEAGRLKTYMDTRV